jgi:hypothetical protein
MRNAHSPIGEGPSLVTGRVRASGPSLIEGLTLSKLLRRPNVNGVIYKDGKFPIGSDGNFPAANKVVSEESYGSQEHPRQKGGGACRAFAVTALTRVICCGKLNHAAICAVNPIHAHGELASASVTRGVFHCGDGGVSIRASWDDNPAIHQDRLFH